MFDTLIPKYLFSIDIAQQGGRGLEEGNTFTWKMKNICGV